MLLWTEKRRNKIIVLFKMQIEIQLFMLTHKKSFHLHCFKTQVSYLKLFNKLCKSNKSYGINNEYLNQSPLS